MCAIARAGTFDRGRESDGAAGLREGEDVVGPGALVEVDGEQVAAFVAEEGKDADDVLTLEVVQEDARRDRIPGLMRALSAANARLLADGAVPLVEAGGGIALRTPFLVGPEPRVDVSASAEEGGE